MKIQFLQHPFAEYSVATLRMAFFSELDSFAASPHSRNVFDTEKRGEEKEEEGEPNGVSELESLFLNLLQFVRSYIPRESDPLFLSSGPFSLAQVTRVFVNLVSEWAVTFPNQLKPLKKSGPLSSDIGPYLGNTLLHRFAQYLDYMSKESKIYLATRERPGTSTPGGGMGGGSSGLPGWSPPSSSSPHPSSFYHTPTYPSMSPSPHPLRGSLFGTPNASSPSSPPFSSSPAPNTVSPFSKAIQSELNFFLENTFFSLMREEQSDFLSETPQDDKLLLSPPSSVQRKTSILFRELIKGGLFSYDTYLRSLIAKGIVTSSLSFEEVEAEWWCTDSLQFYQYAQRQESQKEPRFETTEQSSSPLSPKQRFSCYKCFSCRRRLHLHNLLTFIISRSLSPDPITKTLTTQRSWILSSNVFTKYLLDLQRSLLFEAKRIVPAFLFASSVVSEVPSHHANLLKVHIIIL